MEISIWRGVSDCDSDKTRSRNVFDVECFPSAVAQGSLVSL